MIWVNCDYPYVPAPFREIESKIWNATGLSPFLSATCGSKHPCSCPTVRQAYVSELNCKELSTFARIPGIAKITSFPCMSFDELCSGDEQKAREAADRFVEEVVKNKPEQISELVIWPVPEPTKLRYGWLLMMYLVLKEKTE